MPMNRKLYPANWEAIAQAVKDSANWECSECGRKCRPRRRSPWISEIKSELNCMHTEKKEIRPCEWCGWMLLEADEIYFSLYECPKCGGLSQLPIVKLVEVSGLRFEIETGGASNGTKN